MIIQVDSREKENSEVIEYFESIGQEYFVSKVAGGDYIDFKEPLVAIDLKKDLLELAGNLTKQHARFKREIEIVQKKMKCEFYVLIREPITLEEVKEWHNSRTQVNGEQLYKIMVTMMHKYRVHWIFCDRQNAGKKILDILEWYNKNKKS